MDPIPLSQSVPQLAFACALSGYGLYLSYKNITALQQYEKTSEKAAEWSNTAAQRLHKTRTTQTSGTVTLICSFLTSAVLLCQPSRSTPTILIASSLANATAAYLSRTHMANFWNDSTQTRIPFVEKFNQAIRGSEKVVWLLGTLSMGWAGAALVWAVVGQGWTVGTHVLWALPMGLRMWYVAQNNGL